ncbi:hypothetical protein BY996DRAFT_7394254 [Phakopsora pachyrhizi]|nr:hypothetical protein BY996DRAFT_7394254 [Phakopsora pachyrhizi]
MTFISIFNIKWTHLTALILVGLPFCFNCFDSSTSAALTFGLTVTQHNPHDLINSSLDKAVHQSSRVQSTSSQESRSSVPKIAKFDLNELPENVDSELEDHQEKNISDIGSDSDFNRSSKMQRLMSTGKHLSQDTAQSSTIMTDAHYPEINSNQVTTELQRSFVHSLAAQMSIDVGPSVQLELFKPSKVQSKSISKYIKKAYTIEKPAEPGIKNFKFVGLKKQKSHSTTQKNKSLSRKRKLIPKGESEVIPETEITFRASKIILEHLSKKIEKSGPFDLEGERKHNSPYNKDLLKFIEQNMSNIVHDELGEYEIDKTFFNAVKILLWKDDDEIFYTTEKVISEVMENTKSKYRVHTGISWIKSSATDHIVPSDSATAIYQFKFREVFSKFLTYENFSRFFFTDYMRLQSKKKIEELERKLSEKKKEVRIFGQTLNNFIDRIWCGLTGFLAYVHAISALIPSESSLPLTNSKLIKTQEEALDFFFNLHEKAENFVMIHSKRNNRKISYDKCWTDLSYEDKVQRSLNEILNSKICKDKKAWLYIELWMIRFRPELYEIAAKNLPDGISDSSSRFRSFLNRACFPLFSGLQKFQNPG